MPATDRWRPLISCLPSKAQSLSFFPHAASMLFITEREERTPVPGGLLSKFRSLGRLWRQGARLP